MLAVASRGVGWLARSAPGLILQRPQDVIFGFIAATFTIFIFAGTNSFFWNFLEVVFTVLLLMGLWWAVNYISDGVENSVFRLPKDATTERASREVDKMIEEALD